MPIRQQRTLSRAGFDPLRPPNPILIDGWSVDRTASHQLTLISGTPLRLLGTPPLRIGMGELPVQATQVSDFSVAFDYAEPVDAAGVAVLPQWVTELRGANGEWLAPGSIRMGPKDGPGLPRLNWIISAISNDTQAVIITTAFDFPTVQQMKLFANEENEVQSQEQISGNQFEIVFFSNVFEGDFITCPAWDPRNVDVNGIWLAPSRTRAIP